MGCLGEIQNDHGNRIGTPSAPPAWHWLDECEVPVQVYQHLTSETPGEAELPIHSRNLPESDALREQNDSPDPTYRGCLPSEEYLSNGPFYDGNELLDQLVGDQCSECRCAPGQPHNPECDLSGSPDVSCDRKDDATGCDEAAKVTDAQSNAVETYVFPEIGRFPGQETGVEEETHEDLQGKDADSFVVMSCPECGAVTDIDYGTVGDKPLDCRAHGEPTLAALMAEGYREMAEDSLATAEANLPLDKTTWTVLLTEGYREMAEESLEAAEAFVGACEPEPARSAIGAGPLFGDGVRSAHETPSNLPVGVQSEHVPFSVQSWMFESLCEAGIENLHNLIDDHHDLIIEMARGRFRAGYAKYGSAMYSWSPERRLDETLQELADAVVYPTSGPLE